MSLRFRRYYPLPLLLVFVVAFFTLGIGKQRIIAYTTRASIQATLTTGLDYTNDVDLFDSTIVHSIQLLISEADYQQMITTYQQTGEKDYVHADLILDGVRVNDVGVRLKGNASLRTALGGGGGQWGGGNWGPPGGGNLPQPPGNNQPGRRGAPDPVGQPFDSGSLGSEVKIPLMIKLNVFISGQSYQGYTSIAIRTYGISSDAALLHEPVTNSIIRLIGLPTPQTAYIGFRINDNDEQLYTISEIINQKYVDQYFAEAEGILYKAELGSSLSYQGEDPSAYARSFTQQTQVNQADMAPLIAFMRFLSQSDAADFESELPNYLDVDAFAAYLAVNNLLVNNDSIAGMNNNYYLYYDNATKRITLLMWDANESLGKMPGGSQSARYDLYYQNISMRGPGGGQNLLVKRFLANATFKALYEEKLREIYEKVFASGAISSEVEQYAALVREANSERNLVDPEAYEAAVQKVLSFISQRMEYLKTTPLLGE